MFFYYTTKTAKETWQIFSATEIDSLRSTVKPAFVTALQLSNVDDQTDQEKIKYFGPFYADWDCKDEGEFEDCIEAVKEFIGILEQEYHVRDFSLYATGKRGFHLTIPAEAFGVTKPRTYLPAIYKEIAHRLLTNYLDLSVYTMKKGRLWREPNVKRDDNGLFKVQIKPSELEGLTIEGYKEICAAPRSLTQCEKTKNPWLVTLFESAVNDVAKNIDKRGKKADQSALVKHFRGEFPDSVKEIMRGENLNPSVGFNDIALQLACLAVALEKPKEEFLLACAGLAKTYRGERHRTQQQVTWGLAQKYDYVNGSNSYTYQRTSLTKLYKDKERAADLEPKLIVTAEEIQEELDDLSAGIVLERTGFFTFDDEGAAKRISDLGIDVEKTQQVRDLNGKVTGMVLHVSGEKDDLLPLDVLTTPEGLKEFAAQSNSAFRAMNPAIAAGAFYRLKAEAGKNKQVTAIGKEGLTFYKKGGKIIPVWGSEGGCVCVQDTDTDFRFYPEATDTAIVKTDLLKNYVRGFEKPQDGELCRDVIHNLLRLNNDNKTLALSIGWFVGAFLKPFFLEVDNSYPICQFFGGKGSGKSTTADLLWCLFTQNKDNIRKFSAGSATTDYGIKTVLCQSQSIPAYFEEAHKQDNAGRKNLLHEMIHLIYNGNNTISRGGGTRGNGWSNIAQFTLSAPLLLISEFPDIEVPAIAERSVYVPFTASNGINGREKEADFLTEHRPMLAKIGQEIAHDLLELDSKEVIDVLSKRHAEVCKKLKEDNRPVGQAFLPNRVIASHAKIIIALEFFRDVLERRLDIKDQRDRIDQLIASATIINRTLSLTSSSSDADSLFLVAGMLLPEETNNETRLVRGKDFEFVYSGSLPVYIDFNMHTVYYKAKIHCTRIGQAKKLLYVNGKTFCDYLVRERPAYFLGVDFTDTPLIGSLRDCNLRVDYQEFIDAYPMFSVDAVK